MDRKLIKIQLIKNTLFIFVSFMVVLVVFDILVYNVVKRTVYDSVDDELFIGKAAYEWQMNAGSLVESNVEMEANERIDSSANEIDMQQGNPDEPMPTDFRPEENTNGIDNETVPPNMDMPPEKPEENAKNNNNPETSVIPDNEKQQEIIENSGIDTEDTEAIMEYISKLNTVNPRLITIERDVDENIIAISGINDAYDSTYFDDLFNTSVMNETYSVVENRMNFRGLNFNISSPETDVVYVQLLINIDSELLYLRDSLNSLLMGSVILLAVSLIVSYFLSKRTIKPIVTSYEREAEFVQNASHELRTPLTVLLSKLELLLQSPDSKIVDKSEEISVSLKETKRLSKLINELMILTKSDSNQLKLNKQDTDFDLMIEELLTPYLEVFKDKRIDLELTYGKNYEIDRDKISELIIILLDNAIKYTKDGDEICIKTYSEGKRPVMEIRDTGVGISDEAMKRIFDRFYREDKSHSRKIGGNGLGLSIAKVIVKAHKGTIKVGHNKDKGTVFTVKL
ncbi:MAG: cell wall metabolism sensor histidine kinase WalK [Parasporobacterium sp.]|nr:cell wall metabolism sensor histidine kinase WalK [Parasporobacterium sp.]